VGRPRDQRKTKRTHRRQAAWVVLDGGGGKISCVLWDISEGGARIAAAHGNALPNVFGLFLTKDGRSRRFCQVVWRRGSQLGVRFVAEEVANIDLDPAPAWMRRRQPQPMPVAKPSAPAHDVESAQLQLLLPGYGPHIALDARRNTFGMSAVACGILMMLVGATVLFAVAHFLDDAEWAVAVCSNARSFCQHPEWTGAAGIAMFIIFLTLNGMED
jgi:PilZ domain-containing protein